MYSSLKEFANLLHKKKELIVINDYVDTNLEIAEIADRISKSGNNKALLFKNTKTNFPVLINAFGSDKRMAYALGVESFEEITNIIGPLFEKISNSKTSLWDKLKLLPNIKQTSYCLPKHVKNKKAPCQEVIMSRPDLNLLPILKFWPHEGSKLMTLPLVHTKSLEGARNLGLYPMQVYNENTTSIHWPMHKTGAKHFEEYKKEGKIMPVAIILGGDPIYTWAASAPLPDNLDEYILAGLTRQKPVRLVSCLTQDIEVPEDADFVIEGFIDPSEILENEGVIGSNTGFYSLEEYHPKFHVTCITHKKDAIYPTMITGIPINENTYISRATEKIFLSPLRIFTAPEIKKLYVPGKGTNSMAIVAIKKQYPGQAIKVAHSLWGAEQMMLFKLIIVVDEDVNINDIDIVLKTMNDNWNPDTDTILSKGPLDIHDHAAKHTGFGGKMCVDATVKMPEEESITKETADERLLKFYHENESAPAAKINIMFNEEVDLSEFDTCVWLAINNIDISRDCRIENGSVYVDATVKINNPDHHRVWPNILCMDDYTIRKIDEIWSELNIGEFVESPSLEYKHLIKGDAKYEKIE